MPMTRSQDQPAGATKEGSVSKEVKAESKAPEAKTTTKNKTTKSAAKSRPNSTKTSKANSTMKENAASQQQSRNKSKGKKRKAEDDVPKPASRKKTIRDKGSCSIAYNNRSGPIEMGKDGGWWLCKEHNIYIDPSHPLF